MSMTLEPEAVHFSSNGTVAIPRCLRKEFEIKKGTRATLFATPEGILIKPLTTKFIHSLRGSLKRKPGEKSFADEITYISDIERGQRNPGIKNVAKLAKALGLATAELCKRVNA